MFEQRQQETTKKNYDHSQRPKDPMEKDRPIVTYVINNIQANFGDWIKVLTTKNLYNLPSEYASERPGSNLTVTKDV